MSELQIRFFPIDTLFFRDGSPYNRKELQADVTTIFPPSPTTLAGAIRAAWARALGWDGKGFRGNWDNCCRDKLGAGFQLPEDIRFNGPYLFYQDKPVFPAPAHLLAVVSDNPAKEAPANLVLLSPGKKMETDIGAIRIPVTSEPEKEGKNITSLAAEWWVTVEGMQKILNHEPPKPATLIHQSRLWQIEQRMGNYRETGRITGLNALYAPRHIRLQHGVELAMFVAGLPKMNNNQLRLLQSSPMLTGGEARTCWLSVEKKSIEDYLHPGTPQEGSQYTLIALTPVQIEQALRPDTTIYKDKVVACCNQRPIMLGGWDRREPRKLAPCLRGGTTLFMENPYGGKQLSVGELFTYGALTEWGFGRFIKGHWR